MLLCRFPRQQKDVPLVVVVVVVVVVVCEKSREESKRRPKKFKKKKNRKQESASKSFYPRQTHTLSRARVQNIARHKKRADIDIDT